MNLEAFERLRNNSTQTSFDLNNLKNSYAKYFKNNLKSLHFFQGDPCQKITVMKELAPKNALAKYLWNVLKNRSNEICIGGEDFLYKIWKSERIVIEKSSTGLCACVDQNQALRHSPVPGNSW